MNNISFKGNIRIPIREQETTFKPHEILFTHIVRQNTCCNVIYVEVH